MAEKVLTPEVIEETELPTVSQELGVTSSSPKESAEKLGDNATLIPRRYVAKETLGKTLNTKSKKILGKYTFTKNGAIQVGEYVQDQSGEIKISPDGIVAKNDEGNETFALDGTDGSAVFRGEVRASDFVVVDEVGLVSLANFARSASSYDSLGQSITTAEPNWTTVTDSTMTFELVRPAICVCIAKLTLYTQAGGGSGTEDGLVRINIDDVQSNPSRLWFRNADVSVTGSMHRVRELGSGDHSVSLEGTVNRDSGTPSLVIYDYYFSYIILGN